MDKKRLYESVLEQFLSGDSVSARGEELWRGKSAAASKKLDEYKEYKAAGGSGLSDLATSQLGSKEFYTPSTLQEFDAEKAFRSYLDQQGFVRKFRNEGVWDVEGNAPSAWSDSFLTDQLKALQERVADSKVKDAEWATGSAMAEYENLAKNAERWKQLYAEKDRGYSGETMDDGKPNATNMSVEDAARWQNWLMADYLLGDQQELFDFDAINSRYEAMSDEEYYAEEARLQKQFDELDWEALMNPQMPVYESKTDELEKKYNDALKEQESRNSWNTYKNLAEQTSGTLDLEKYYRENIDGYGQQDVQIEGYDSEVFSADRMLNLVYFINHAHGSGYQFNTLSALQGTGLFSNKELDTVWGYYEKGYNFLLPEEIVVYNDLYATDPKIAQGFLDSLQEDLLKRRYMVKSAETDVLATSKELAVPAFMASVWGNVIDAAAVLPKAVQTLQGNDSYFSPLNDPANLARGIRSAQGEGLGEYEWANKLGTVGGNNVLQQLYYGGASAVDNAFRLGAGGGNPGVALALAGMGSTSSTLQDLSLRDDMSPTAKVAQAALTGALEVATEKIGLDNLFKMDVTSAGKYLLNSMGAELGEEVINALGQEGLDYVVAQVFGHEAEIKSAGERGTDLINTVVQTAISAALMGSGGAASIAISNQNAGNTLKNQGDLDAVVSIAESLGENTESVRIAKTIREMQKGGKGVSNYNIGRLVRAVVNDIGEENAQVVNRVAEEAIENRLVELGQSPEAAKKNAPAIRKVSQGGKLNLKERTAVAWDDRATQVLKEMTVAPSADEAAGPEQSNWRQKMETATQEAKAASAGRQKQLADALTNKSSTTGRVAKAAQKADSLASGKNKSLAPTEVTFKQEGESVKGTFTRFEKGKDGSLRLVVTAGNTEKTVSIDEVTSAGDKGMATIYHYVQDPRHEMSAQEASTMVNTYAQVGGDAGTFVLDFENAYLSGYSGMESPGAQKDNKVYAIAYDQGKQEAAADEKTRVEKARQARRVETPSVGWLGEVAADADVKGSGKPGSLKEAMNGFTDSQKAMAEFATALSETAKVNISLFASKADSKGNITVQNGSYDPNTHTIYLDINSGAQTAEERSALLKTGSLGDAIGRVAGHEVTHVLENTSVEYYSRYKQAVKAAFKAKGVDYSSLIHEKLKVALENGEKLTYYGAEAEVIADASEYMLQDSKFVKNLETGLKGKIKGIVQTFLDKVNEAFKRLGLSGHFESRILRTMQDGVAHYEKDLQSLWDLAFDEMLGAEVKSDAEAEAEKMEVGGEEKVQKSIRERDDAYMAAVKRGDMKTAQKMVDEAAKAAGYEPLKLFHGTNAFGFTKVDVSKSDDRLSFFATNNLDVAAGYFPPYYDRDEGEIKNAGVKEIGKPGAHSKALPADATVTDVLNALASIPGEEHYKKARVATEEDRHEALKPSLYNLQQNINDLKGWSLPYSVEFYLTDIEYAIEKKEYSSLIELSKQRNDFNTIPYDSLGFHPYNVLSNISFAMYQAEQVLTADGAYVPGGDGWTREGFYTKGELMNRYNDLTDGANTGVYQLYANNENQLVIHAGGANWNRINVPDNMRTGKLYGATTATTREFAEWASQNGYDSIKFEDLYDNGPYGGNEMADIYAFFANSRPSAVKSADPVTYDESGNVIPLSERFNAANEDIRYSKRYVNNRPVVWINENILEGKPDGQSDKNFIKNYLASHIDDVYTIIESGYKVKPAKQFPAEYLYSKSAQQAERFNRSAFKGKLKMVAGIGEMIEIATNRRWEKTRHPGNKNAKYGVYRYDSNVAFQSGDGINAYSVELVVLNADDGQKYLYDIVNIKKDDATAKGLMDKARGAKKFAQQTNAVNESVSQVLNTVKHEFDDDSSPDGIEIDDDTGSAYASQKSIRTWADSDYVAHRNEAAERLAKSLGVSISKAKKWIDDVNSISAYILGNKARLDYIPTAVKGMSAFKSNPEYGGSIDMSTICAKRRLATGTLDAIQRVLGDAVLTKDDFLHIREMMKERGYEVACGLCFVESSRKNLSKYNKQFLDQYKTEHPDSELGMVDLNTVEGLERVRSNPDTADVYAAYEKFMNKLAQRKPKLFEKRTEYNHEILKKFKSDASVGIKNTNGGLRLQSFSDFEIVHLIDMMQVITDMASVGLAGQAYTKVPDFAWALGDTGLKINLSLIAKDVDTDGNLVFDDVEGMNHLEAEKLRNAYSKNVGTIVVTFTDEQTIAAMKSDFIDFIIPFHRSQWQKGDYKKLGLPEGTKDYTIHQNEKEGRKRVKENFLPNAYWQDNLSGTENAKYYLDICAKAGRTPKFAKFLVNNGDGSYSLQPDGSTDGYWKLLIDFKMYDNEGNRSKQLPVHPNFNMDQAMRMLEEYKGEHDTFPVAQDVVDDFVKEYRGDKGGVQRSDGRYTVNPVQRSRRDLPSETSAREFLLDADSSIAATIEERNALSIYQNLLLKHAEASDAVVSAEQALLMSDEAGKPDARKNLAAARARQKDLYDRLLNVERTAHVQTVVKRTNQLIGDLYGKNQAELDKMLADKERHIASLKADITGLKGAARTQREADIREQEREISTLKSKAAQALLANSERYQQQISDIRLRRDVNIEIGKRTRHIKRIVKKLNDRIIHEEDYKNVKEPLKPAVHALVQTFIDGFGNMVFNSDTASHLRTVYDEIARDDGAPEFYSDDVADWLSDLADMKELDALIRAEGSSSLSAAEEKLVVYSRVAEIADHIYKMVTDADEIFVNGKRESFAAVSAEVGNALHAVKDKPLLVGKARKAKETLDDLLVRGNLTPQYFFESLKNSGLTSLFNGLLDGQTRYAQAIREGRDAVKEAKRTYKYDSWRNLKIPVEFKTEQGHVIALTTEQMMWVYATAKREATNKLMDTHHLDQGGFRYEAGDLPRLKGKMEAIPGSDRLHKLSAADVKKITDTLTAEQKACADELVSYLSNECAELGNEASLELFGIKKYNEEYYFPFKTASDQRYQRSDAGSTSTTNDARVKHASFTHSLRKGANTPLVMGNFFDVISDHINLMATYSSFVVPIESMNRVLNAKMNEDADDSGSEVTIRSMIGRKHGDAAQKYIADLIKDLNGGPQTDNRGGMSALFRAFKRGAVMGSLSVALQQPTAIVRAFSYVNPKYFAHITMEGNKKTWERMMKYSGTAVIKDMGKFDVGTGKMANDWIANSDVQDYKLLKRMKFLMDNKGFIAAKNNFVETLTALPGFMDRVTWTHIWKAVEAEQAELNPSMDRNSEEFLRTVGARFDAVINHTQVYDSVLAKSQNMRSKNPLTQMSTAFMSEPTLNANMYFSALTGQHTPGERTGMIASVIASNILAAAFAAMISAWNKDDDKRKFGEKYLGEFASRAVDNINPLTMIPYVADLWNMFSGYDIERTDLSVVKDLLDYGTTFFGKLKDGDDITWRDVENFGGTIANLTGVPAKNISRDIRRIRNLIFTDKSASSPAAIKYTLLENALPLGLWSDSNKAYCQRLVSAVLDGDTQEAYDLWDYLTNSKKASTDSLNSNIRTDLKERVKSGEITPAQATSILRKYASYKNDKDNIGKPLEWLEETE